MTTSQHHIRESRGGLARWLRHAVTSLALAACVISLALLLHGRYIKQLSIPLFESLAAMSTAGPVAPSPNVAAVVDPRGPKYRALGQYLARRYMISAEAATDIVARAHAVAAQVNLDPLVILAVISIESRFNPIAESANGAKGLMQIMPRLHREKFNGLGGEQAVFEPYTNILVGARILQEYMLRTRDLGEALQMYVGDSDENDSGYASKVLAERERLSAVLRQSRLI